MTPKEKSNLKPWSNVSVFGAYYSKHPRNKDMKVCLTCFRNIPSKRGNTNSLKSHLETAHKIYQFIKLKDQNKKIQAKIGAYASIEPVDTAESVINDLVCKSLVAPHAIEKGRGFKVLFKRSFNVNPTQYWAWKTINETYEILSKNLRLLLSKVDKVSISLDDWTSHPNHGFCNINAYIHDVHDESKFTRYSLGLILLSATDGVSMATSILSHLQKFSVKPIFVTTDGASNMKTMATHANFLRQECLLHGLNLLVNDIIFPKKSSTQQIPQFPSDDEDDSENVSDNDSEDDQNSEHQNDDDISICDENTAIPAFTENDAVLIFGFDDCLDNDVHRLVKNIRKVVNHFRRSTKSRNFLRKYTKLSLLKDCKTRWSSTFQMLARFSRISADIKKASLDSKEIFCLMRFCSEKEEDMLRALLSLLAPFEEATRLLSSESNTLVTADLILMNCLNKINAESLKLKFKTRVLSRRQNWSNILLHLQNETDGIEFFKKPSNESIVELYDRVSLI